MIEPALIADDVRGVGALRFLPERLQRIEHAPAALLARDPAVVDADTDGRQTKSHGGNAAIGVGSGTVADEAVCRIGFIPKIVESGLLEVIKKLVVAGEIFRRRGDPLGRGPFCVAINY